MNKAEFTSINSEGKAEFHAECKAEIDALVALMREMGVEFVELRQRCMRGIGHRRHVIFPLKRPRGGDMSHPGQEGHEEQHIFRSSGSRPVSVPATPIPDSKVELHEGRPDLVELLRASLGLSQEAAWLRKAESLIREAPPAIKADLLKRTGTGESNGH